MKKKNKLNEFKEAYKNNLLFLIYILYSFVFSFSPLLLSIFFSAHFSSNFPGTNLNQSVSKMTLLLPSYIQLSTNKLSFQ